MRRHKSLIKLSHFHRRVLIIALICKKGSPELKGYPSEIIEKAAYVQDFYFHEMNNHNQLLFHCVYAEMRSCNQKIDSIIDELTTTFQYLGKLIEQLSSNEDLIEQLNEIGVNLGLYARTIERQLFQEVQEHLNEEKLMDMGRSLEKQLLAFPLIHHINN